MQNPPRLRATPEELTQALAAIEAQREQVRRQQEEEGRYPSSTVSVDETVRESSLSVTPEEIKVEVLSRRDALKRSGAPSSSHPCGASPRSLTWASATPRVIEARDSEQAREERKIGPVLVGVLLLKLLLIYSIVSLFHRW